MIINAFPVIMLFHNAIVRKVVKVTVTWLPLSSL